jgi:valyl-tRNA synthetase
LHPQAHEIIRTWAFYSIVKAHHHFGQAPWQQVAISGWGLAHEGSGKISKSRGGGPMSPLEMIERYSADAVRFWAASTSLGRDAIISEEKIQAGAKLVNKLWNVARFSQRFIAGYRPPPVTPPLQLADRWILDRLAGVLAHAGDHYKAYDYATAKSEVEAFFWADLADNYLEFIKKRLYEGHGPAREAARYTLYQLLLATIRLLAPIVPHITEQIYRGLFAGDDLPASVHAGPWPVGEDDWLDPDAARQGQALLAIATAVRRYKSDNNLSLGAQLQRMQLAADDPALRDALQHAAVDIASVTRAREITIAARPEPGLTPLPADDQVRVSIMPAPQA